MDAHQGERISFGCANQRERFLLRPAAAWKQINREAPEVSEAPHARHSIPRFLNLGRRPSLILR